jgi:hypothetical protein
MWLLAFLYKFVENRKWSVFRASIFLEDLMEKRKKSSS